MNKDEPKKILSSEIIEEARNILLKKEYFKIPAENRLVLSTCIIDFFLLNNKEDIEIIIEEGFPINFESLKQHGASYSLLLDIHRTIEEYKLKNRLPDFEKNVGDN